MKAVFEFSEDFTDYSTEENWEIVWPALSRGLMVGLEHDQIILDGSRSAILEWIKECYNTDEKPSEALKQAVDLAERISNPKPKESSWTRIEVNESSSTKGKTRMFERIFESN